MAVYLAIASDGGDWRELAKAPPQGGGSALARRSQDVVRALVAELLKKYYF